MKYPKEFVEKAKAEFPEFEVLQGLLDKDTLSNSEDRLVRDLMGKASAFRMPADGIVVAFELGREGEVKKAAEKALRRQMLCAELDRIFEEQAN